MIKVSDFYCHKTNNASPSCFLAEFCMVCDAIFPGEAVGGANGRVEAKFPMGGGPKEGRTGEYDGGLSGKGTEPEKTTRT